MKPHDFKFNVGDPVIIRNVEECPFGYNDSMFQAEGRECTIKSRSRQASRDGTSNAYTLYEVSWTWGEINFELAGKVPSEDSVAAILLNY